MKRKNIISFILSFLYTITLFVGKLFSISGSFYPFFHHVLVSILAFLVCNTFLFFIIRIIITRIDNYTKKEEKNKNNLFYKFLNIFNKYPILITSIVLILSWLIYFISYYPGIINKDAEFQILQALNIPNKYSDYVVLLDNNVLLTNHHPVIHSLMLGYLVKLGIKLFNSFNIGLFFSTIIQSAFFIFTLGYTIKFLKELKVSVKYRFIVLLIYAFVPVFPFYSITLVKDVIFTCFIILYSISIYKLVNNTKLNIKNTLLFLLLIILTMLFRNNGFHVIILSLPFLLFVRKDKIKILLLVLFVLGFNFSYNNIILPKFKITQGSVREKYSIPFQQTARYVKYYKDEVTNEEKESIDKVLGYDTLSTRYNPESSDPVKNEFNRYATKEDLNNYFITWKNQFFKHPIIYFEATINNTYGYYYPFKKNWYVYNAFLGDINNYGFNYHFNNLKSIRKVLRIFSNNYINIPLFGLIVNIGFNTYIYMFMIFYLIYKKKYRALLYYLPCIVIFMVCIASPVNAYFRYAMPYIFSTPLFIGIFLKEIGDNNG